MAKKNPHDIIQFCAYCERAECLNNSEIMLCEINGIVASNHRCKKFLYDPLKRDPAQPVKLLEIDESALIL